MLTAQRRMNFWFFFWGFFVQALAQNFYAVLMYTVYQYAWHGAIVLVITGHLGQSSHPPVWYFFDFRTLLIAAAACTVFGLAAGATAGVGALWLVWIYLDAVTVGAGGPLWIGPDEAAARGARDRIFQHAATIGGALVAWAWTHALTVLSPVEGLLSYIFWLAIPLNIGLRTLAIEAVFPSLVGLAVVGAMLAGSLFVSSTVFVFSIVATVILLTAGGVFPEVWLHWNLFTVTTVGLFVAAVLVGGALEAPGNWL